MAVLAQHCCMVDEEAGGCQALDYLVLTRSLVRTLPPVTASIARAYMSDGSFAPVSQPSTMLLEQAPLVRLTLRETSVPTMSATSCRV